MVGRDKKERDSALKTIRAETREVGVREKHEEEGQVEKRGKEVNGAV